VKATKWQIDAATTLVKSDEGFSIIWAGCEFGPEKTLQEVAVSPLLEECEAAMRLPGEPCERSVCDTLDGSQTILK
jgi:hypothetical protein